MPATARAHSLEARTLLKRAVICLTVLACSDGPSEPSLEESPYLSEPVHAVTSATHGTSNSASIQQGDVVYVSIPAGTFPDAAIAVIRHVSTGQETVRALADGGLHPVAIAARVGDAIRISTLGDAEPRNLMAPVPHITRPKVIRVVPPRGKTDVPLNVRLDVVFSKPMDESTLGNILLSHGSTPIPGRITLLDDGVTAEFEPSQLLAPTQRYELTVPMSVRDVAGNAMEEASVTEFITGSSIAVAEVRTREPALFRNPAGLMRTFEMNAVRLSDGRVSGTWRVFYEETGHGGPGIVQCFAIRDNGTVWVAGPRTPPHPEYSGDWGWLANDNRTKGLPDQLTMAHPIVQNGLGEAEDFCMSTPLVDPLEGPFVLHDLESGDIEVRGATPLPTTGSVRVVTSSTGFPIDPDGYTLRLGDVTQTIGANDSLTVRALGPGVYPVSVEDVAEGCTVAPIEPLSVTAGTFGRLNIDVDCYAPTIAFVADVENNVDVYFSSPSGGAQFRLTTAQGADWDPAWSSDGKRIAFSSHREDNGQFNRDIYVIASNGTAETRLTDDPATDYEPAWSPDGSRIAFVRESDGNPDIYVINAESGAATQLTNGPSRDRSPAWSPDGTRIVFSSDRDGGYDIYVMNVDGSGVQRLTAEPQDDADPVFSPDGTRIAFSRLMDREPDQPACTAFENIDTGSDPAGYDVMCRRDILILSADGSGTPARLAFPTSHVSQLAGGWFRSVFIARHPTWSPDGQRIAAEVFVCFSDLGGADCHSTTTIVIAPASGAGGFVEMSGGTLEGYNPRAQFTPAWRP